MRRDRFAAIGAAVAVLLLAAAAWLLDRPPALPPRGAAEPPTSGDPGMAEPLDPAGAMRNAPFEPPQADLSATARPAGTPGLAGQVRWANGEPTRGVRVLLAGHEGMQALTGADGMFRIGKTDALPRPLPETLGLHLRPPCWKTGQTFSLALRERPEGPDLVLEPILLPNVIDLEIEISIDAGLFRMLEEARFHGIEVTISEPRHPKAPFVKQLAAVALPLDRRHFLTTTRIPYQEALDCVLFFRSDPESGSLFQDGPEKQQVHRDILFPKRDAVPLFRCDADQRIAFRGSVHDHLGRPLPEAGVRVREPMASHPDGVASHELRVLETGEFFYFGDPEARFGVHAEYSGTSATVEGLSCGQTDFRIVLDLSGCTALFFRRGGQPIQNYRIGVTRHLFGRRALPRLPFHADGMSWLPRNRGSDAEWFLLTWREGEAWFESAFRKPAPAADGTCVIALEEHNIRPCGTLDVVFNSQGPYLLSLQRVDPPPPYPPTQPGQTTPGMLHTLVGSSTGPEARLLGIPEGFYRVEIGTGRAGQTLLTLPRHYISGGSDRLDIPALLEKSR